MKRSNSTVVLVAACIVAIMSGCVFAPTDINKSENKIITSSPQITYSTNLILSEDTIYIYGVGSYETYYNINFNFKCNTGDIFQIKCTMDGNDKNSVFFLNTKYYSVSIDSLHQEMYSSNSINYFVKKMTKGTHTLSMQFITRSGSKTFADYFGLEGYAVKKWTIIVMESCPSVKDTIKNGFLELSWQKYKDRDFKGYYIESSSGNKQDTVAINSFVDSSYIGGDYSYAIYIVKKNGEKVFYGKKTVNYDFPKIEITHTKNNEILFCFEKTKFYNATKGVSLFLQSFETNEKITMNNENDDDTCFIVNSSVNNQYYGQIEYIPEYISKDYYSLYQTKMIIPVYENGGFPFIDKNTSMNTLSFLTDKEIVYSVGTSLLRYSITENKIISKENSSQFYALSSVSGSNKTILYNTYYDQAVLLSNISGTTIEKKIDTSLFSYPKSLCSISDNESILSYNVSKYRFQIYNINTKQIIAESDSVNNYYYEAGKISSNANFVLYKDDSIRLCKITNNKFIKIWSGEYDYYSRFYFNSENEDEFIIANGSKIYINSTQTGKNIINYKLDEAIYNFDFKNNEMLCYKDQYLRIRNIRTGGLIREYKTRDYNADNLYLSNHILIFNTGVLYFVK